MTEHDEDDPQLKSLRAVWLSMPDEEPPDRGLAELMAAARVKADQLATPSWWERVVAVLRRPAVLALATVMVLLGGAVILGRRGDKMEANPPAPASPAVEQLPETTRNVEQSERAPAADTKDLEPHEAPAKPEVTATPRPRREALHAAPTGSTGEADRPRQPVPTEAAPTEAPPAPPLEATDAEAVAGERSDTGLARAPRGGRAPEPAHVPAAESPSPVTLAQVKAAATRGDCAAARALASQSARQDPRYYKSAVLADPSIKKCLRQ